MNDQEQEQLTQRVFKGFLMFATKKDVKEQLLSEGIEEKYIKIAIEKAEGTHDRLFPNQKVACCREHDS